MSPRQPPRQPPTPPIPEDDELQRRLAVVCPCCGQKSVRRGVCTACGASKPSPPAARSTYRAAASTGSQVRCPRLFSAADRALGSATRQQPRFSRPSPRLARTRGAQRPRAGVALEFSPRVPTAPPRPCGRRALSRVLQPERGRPGGEAQRARVRACPRRPPSHDLAGTSREAGARFHPVPRATSAQGIAFTRSNDA
jgi:hypothetical protein